MRPKDKTRFDALASQLDRLMQSGFELPGVSDSDAKTAFLEQMVESERRIQFVRTLAEQTHDECRRDPFNDAFDPMRAAVMEVVRGDRDEAFWLAFLAVHFGKNLRTKWRLARDIYGGLQAGNTWTWARLSRDIGSFDTWLREAVPQLKNDGVKRHFGNHRKYQSLNNVGLAVRSYVRWVNGYGNHEELVRVVTSGSTGPRDAFHQMYVSMSAVAQFGRTGRFDYLTMVGNLGLAPIEPGFTYMDGATGPRRGACLLFCGNTSCRLSISTLESRLTEFEAPLGIGMQALEDALCNWQKSPRKFKGFRG